MDKMEMDDERLEFLIKHLTEWGKGGFAHALILEGELLSALTELKYYRDRPSHCPCCDGDHL